MKILQGLRESVSQIELSSNEVKLSKSDREKREFLITFSIYPKSCEINVTILNLDFINRKTVRSMMYFEYTLPKLKRKLCVETEYHSDR